MVLVIDRTYDKRHEITVGANVDEFDRAFSFHLGVDLWHRRRIMLTKTYGMLTS